MDPPKRELGCLLESPLSILYIYNILRVRIFFSKRKYSVINSEESKSVQDIKRVTILFKR